MANKSDILLKYKTAYSNYEKESKDRLKELKRSFSNEKLSYLDHLDELNGHLKINQDDFYNQIMTLHQDFLSHQNNIESHFNEIKAAFNEEIFHELSQLDQKANEEDQLYDQILEEFELRKQDALDMYLSITKKNNADIDYEMQIHHEFINQENQKLLKYKENYDTLSAELSNKMLWTIEKSKNAIESLNNQLNDLHKDDLFSLNQQILQALTDMRGARNDINIIFKETSQHLSVYKEEIYNLRTNKQKPYSDINHQLIHKLIKQIRLANDNKVKYQTIIKNDLEASLKKLYPTILKAYQDKKHDQLEKYILQTEILQEKAAFLIKKIEKITNYNISTYQKRIKEIKVETFSHNEEIKFTYAVPIKYIDHAISIYSNYNFYFNQGFNELDTLLSDLISFSQNFNELRNRESLQIKDDLSSYQNNYLAKVSDVSNHLSDLLYTIDDIAFQISTLESKTRLEVSEIKKEIINIDIKGDYLKYLDTLSTDYELAKKEYKDRIKTINLKKLYYDKTHELYISSIDLDEDHEKLLLEQIYHQSLTDIESSSHKDHYDYIKAHFDIYYKHQANMVDLFMKIVKQRLTQTLKSNNYQLAKGYFDHELEINQNIQFYENQYNQLNKKLSKVIDLNNQETDAFIQYLDEEGERQSTLNYLEELRLELNRQLDHSKAKKTKPLSMTILNSYQTLHQTNEKITETIGRLITKTKHALYLLNHNTIHLNAVIESLLDYRHILYTFTTAYYETTSLAYQYHHLDHIESLNNYYDDSTIFMIESSIRVLDQVNHTNKTKKRIKIVTKYLISMIEFLKKAQNKFIKLNHVNHNHYIKPTIKKIAIIEIETNNEKDIIENYFDALAKKSLKKRHNIKRQKTIIAKMAHRLNSRLIHQIDTSKKIFDVHQKNGQNKQSFIQKKVTRIIKKNDRALIKMNREINRIFTKQYEAMSLDYHDQINLISELKDKILFDQNVEKQYIDYITKKAIENIQRSKKIVYYQISKIPNERKEKLQEIQQSKYVFFEQQHNQLMQKLSALEKQKFIEVPLLEKKIEQKEISVKKTYEMLYQKHKDLEQDYLNQYTNSNEAFKMLHEGFQKDLVTTNLRYDSTLNQPLDQLLKTEISIDDKVNIIRREVSSKTKDKVEEIKKDKIASQNKQKRIIQS
jgi:hypothetical protein